MISSILRSSGFSVGLYTSPHLQSITERINVQGSPISRQAPSSICCAILMALLGCLKQCDVSCQLCWQAGQLGQTLAVHAKAMTLGSTTKCKRATIDIQIVT